MLIVGTLDLDEAPVEMPVERLWRDGRREVMSDAIQTESLLSVYVNDMLTMKLGCSASHLTDLVIGRLFTEGIIEGPHEVDAVSVCEQSLRADVMLRSRTADLSRESVEVTPTCCTNNVVVNRYFSRDLDLSPVKPIPWLPEQVFAIAEEFGCDRTIHARTRGAHSAYLCREGQVLCVREDIGRHNAFDKVIGWALGNDIDLGACAIFTSGRVPTDMVVKAIRARVPILISKAVATDKTVDMARRYDLTLICEAKADSCLVLNDGMGTGATPSTVSAPLPGEGARTGGQGHEA